MKKRVALASPFIFEREDAERAAPDVELAPDPRRIGLVDEVEDELPSALESATKPNT